MPKPGRVLNLGAVIIFILMLLLETGLDTPTSLALENGLARTPPLGWSSWYAYGCNITEQKIKSQADAMVSTGMANLGYSYINLDDCWQGGRDVSGNLYPDPLKFPNGMKNLADYIHSKNLKFGIYTARGTQTCADAVGSQDYEVQDAKTFAAWEVDFVKDDDCYFTREARSQYQTMRDALQSTGRPVVFSLSTAHTLAAPWGNETANLWRTGPDVAAYIGGSLRVSWDEGSYNVLNNIEANAKYAEIAGPGGWNDPDHLIIGKGLSATEDQSVFSLWAMMAAPLIAGNDLNDMTPTTRDILTNPEVIAVNQDPLGIQATVIEQDTTGKLQVWAKQLQVSGTQAVLLFNKSDKPANISLNLADLGLSEPVSLRDLWAHAERTSLNGSYSSNVPAHGVVMLKATGTPPPLPAPGATYLSDFSWYFARTGYATVQKDRSISGANLRLKKKAYSKGLGTHANSDIRYNLGRKCTSFMAEIGIDDDTNNKQASVIFQVYADGTKLYDSGKIEIGSPTKQLELNIKGKETLRLVVLDNFDGISHDHADWGGAVVRCT